MPNDDNTKPGVLFIIVIYCLLMIDAILFDMDGVLVDSERYWSRYWVDEVFPHVISGTPTTDEITGRSVDDTISYLDSTYVLNKEPNELRADAKSFAEEMYRDRATIQPEMSSLFNTVHNSNADVGVVSSALRGWIEVMIEQSTLREPDIIVSADDLEAPGKPNPAVYNRAIDLLQATSSECVVVEDSVQGARAAKRAGTTVIRYQCDQATEAIPEADHIASDINDLQTHISGFIEP